MMYAHKTLVLWAPSNPSPIYTPLHHIMCIYQAHREG